VVKEFPGDTTEYPLAHAAMPVGASDKQISALLVGGSKEFVL
jgi:hypothetical protein